MFRKGQERIMDEFAWIILGAVGFVLLITIVLTITVSSPIIEPKTLDTSLTRGVSYTFTITVRSEDGRPLTRVNLTSSGEIKDWVTFDRNNFEAENSTTVRVRVDVPSSASIRTYTGAIKAETAGGSSTMNVNINVVQQTVSRVLDYRPISLGDLEVRYNRSTDVIASRTNFEVNKGLFAETKEAFSTSTPNETLAITTGAYLDIIVVDSNENGNFVVEFNGLEVLNQKTGVGKIRIPLDRSMLNETNIISLKTTGPPFWQFWSKSVYKIERIDFGIEFFDVVTQQKKFTMSRNEIDNFHHFQLQSRIGEYSTPLEDLVVKINGQTVYINKPPLILFNQTIDRDMLGNKLFLSDENTVSFLFERSSSISLKDTTVLVYFYR